MTKTKEKKYAGLRKLIPYVKKNKRLYSIMITVMLIGVALNMSIPIFSANAIGFLTEKSFLMALYMAGAVLLVRIALSGIWTSQNIYYAKIDATVKMDIKNTLITAITCVTMSKNDRTNTGLYIDRINDDVGRCSDVMIDLMSVLLELLSNIGFLIYIAFINVYFFITLVAYVLVLWFFDSKKEKAWFKDRKVVKELHEVSTSAYNEQIRGLRDIKSLNIRKNTIIESGKKFFKTVTTDYLSRVKRSKYALGRNICAVFFEVGFIVMGVFFIQYELISLTSFLIIYMYHGNVRMLTQYIASIKEYAITGELAARRIFEVIDTFPKENFGDKVLTDVVGEVKFNNVSFAYEEDRYILRDVNLNFEANKSTAIVGKSGSGKSTILALANKLYNVNAGEILIDGINVQDLTEDSLRNNIGVVTQTPYIFNSSVRENLLLVKPDATEEELTISLKRAQIYDFIINLPEGLESRVGENGVMLSGGQKQRIAISRVLLKNSKIIILDEATSALDNENQEKIVDVINELKRDHTIIIVAHRLSSIVDVDKIVVIDDGKVIAEGKHKELMKKCSFYRDLYYKEEDNDSLN